jgi:hypothetical protein
MPMDSALAPEIDVLGIIDAENINSEEEKRRGERS